MKMYRSGFAAVLSLAAASAIALAAGPAGLTGDWAAGGGKARVNIVPCGEVFCGSPAGEHARVVFDLRSQGANHWRGDVIDPQDGSGHPVSMTLADDSRLLVKGCYGPFCFEQVWTRTN